MPMARRERVIGIVQPTYLPWLPFFERMAASDAFVLLDDVEYSKNSAFNRNAIKTAHGRHMLTVPVLYRGASSRFVGEVEVNPAVAWARKHWLTISQSYAHAPYWPRYKDVLADVYHRAHGPRLIDWMMPMIAFLRKELALDVPCHLSSQLGITTRRNRKLVDICRALDGTHFIVKPGTADYHPPEEFEPHGIRFAVLNYSTLTYRQEHGPFVPGLSALDYLLNCGPGRPPFAARAQLT